MTVPQPRSSAEGTPGPPPGCPAHASTHADAVPMSGPRFQSGPDQLYREMRSKHGPVAPVLLPGDVPAWLVIGYRELHTVTTNPALFTRDSDVWNMWETIPQDWPMRPMVGTQPSILYATGENHRIRSEIVTDALSGVDPFELRAFCEEYADGLIDEFSGRGEADLIAEYAKVLPALVLARVFGFEDREGAALVPEINTLVDGTEGAVRSREVLLDGILTLMNGRENMPVAADVATRMRQHPHAPELTHLELAEDLLVNFIGGHQPTSDWIGNTLRLMLTDDRFAASLTGGRHSVAEAMNEVLWEDTPTQNIAGRWATRDTRLGTKHIRSGDLLILCFAGANADPQVRPDQHSFTGGNNAFLSFGHGEHRCPYPGQEIAETIARTGIEVLLDRLPDVDLSVSAQALVWRASPWLRGLEALPVHFTPTAAVGGIR